MKIKEIQIENFRGILNQHIIDIKNALVLIGKNNSGKSAVLSAIRTFWGDYNPSAKDFYKGKDCISIQVTLEVSDEYLNEIFYDEKVGFTKVPSSAADYNSAKNNTIWADTAFTAFKSERDNVIETDAMSQFRAIWDNATKQKLLFDDDNTITIRLNCQHNDLKPQYFIHDTPIRDFPSYLPSIAFIDDSRNFDDEEVGKPKTLTANIVKIIQSNILAGAREISCQDCGEQDCDNRCINAILEKSTTELSTKDLEKLINYRMKQSSEQITQSISERFQQNYRRDFRVNLKATSNMEKSFTVTTKIFDPALESEIDLSNVGAGVRSIYVLSLLQAYQALSSRRSLFLIEEPELYLHPELQKEMAQTLSSLSDNSQIVFTTHSPLLLNEFHSDEIRKVSMNITTYQSEVSAATLDDILNEIGYSSQDIINTDFVLFVEGPDDKEVIENILIKYYDVEINRISIIDTKSCKNIGFYATLRFLNKTTMSQSFAIIRDADTMAHEIALQKLQNQLSENISSDYMPTITPNIYITKYSAIEGFVLSPDLLVRHGIFASTDRVYRQLKHDLGRNKERHINYFRNQNSTMPERIAQFESDYDEKIINVEENLEWIKINVRGHDYCGYANSIRIPYSTYVQELPESAFEDILGFLDSIEFFSRRRIH